MKRILLALIFGCFSVHVASAKITPIEDYSRDPATYVLPRSDNCENYGLLSSEPEGKECEPVARNNLICYQNCHCPEGYTNSCTGTGEIGLGSSCDGKYASCTCDDSYEVCGSTEVGEGEACTADGTSKYISCSCPASYSQICNGVGEVGSGNDCRGKYTGCKCSASYQKICSAAAGEGEPCTADGGYKYSACDWSQYDGTSCRAVTDATPYYNSIEYIEHANAFRGIENTRVLVESQGAAAIPAYVASNFYPVACVSASNEYLGAGNWYLPSAGEMLYLTGADFNNMSSIDDGSAITDDNFTVVNNALNTLWTKFSSTEKWVTTISADFNFSDGDYFNVSPDIWTSSKSWNNYPYFWFPKGRFYNYATSGIYPAYLSGNYGQNASTGALKHTIRPVAMLQNCFNNANISVGSVIFNNMSVGSASTAQSSCASNKFPIGVVYWISPDKTLVRIISTKMAAVNKNNVFDPNNPTGTDKNNTLGIAKDDNGKPLYNYRVSWLDSAKADYNSGDKSIAAMPEDAWGCTAINPENPNCSTTPLRRKAMTCTQDDGSTEFTDHANAFKGREYTDAILAQHGSKGQAAYQASQFYPKEAQYSNTAELFKNNPFIGQGKWYLPSAGEMLYLSGVDFSSMSGITNTVGIGSNFSTIETSLGNIAAYAADGKLENAKASYWASHCSTFAARSPRIWTSSEADADNAYYFDSTDGTIKIANKMNPTNEQGNSITIGVRPVIMLKNFGFVGYNPQIGDILYSDMRIGKAAKNYNYDNEFPYSRVFPIGVIYWVSPDKSTVRVVSCRRYYSSYGAANNSKWLSSGTPVDIAGIPDNIWDNVPEGQPLVLGDLHNGRSNTQAAVNQIGVHALIPYAASQFYAPGVASGDTNFGQGKWYVPAIGELMDLYGYDWSVVSEYVSEHGYYSGDSAAVGNNFTTVNTALTTLGSSIATAIGNNNYLASSSEYNLTGSGTMMTLIPNYGIMGDDSGGYHKASPFKLRVSALLENRFRSNAIKPVIGDVMYADLSYGSANDYDGSKTPVGVVYWVSADHNSARIINLKNLTVKRTDGAIADEYTFIPDAPYTQNSSTMPWEWHNGVSSGSNTIYTNITGIKDLKNNWASSLSNRNAGTTLVPDCD